MEVKNLTFHPTPLTTIQRTSVLNNRLEGTIFKRDDLFEKAGGGSKARMLQYILNDVTDFDVLLTAGGPCSNFNRACALQCAELGVPMHLVLYSEHPEEFEKSTNLFICKLAGVRITICQKSNVAETLNNVEAEYYKKGLKVKRIYGGGRSLEGIYAYYAAVKELISQRDCLEIDRVFVACGTGTTVSGMLAGFQKYLPNVEVHAISVARRADVEIPIIEENIATLNDFLGTNYDTRKLFFHDDFILGEYGCVNEKLISFIEDFSRNTGVLVDPIYTGKALWGMHELTGESESHNQLFWHTGAIYTLLSNVSKFKI